MNLFWIVLIAIVVLGMLLIVCSCCVVAGDSDRRDEELLLQHKSCLLSDNEKQTLEMLLRAFEEDGVNFVINDGKIVDYEVVE